ncbi:hypothetical protein GCM10027596_35100 [Nocardioides korecus]
MTAMTSAGPASIWMLEVVCSDISVPDVVDRGKRIGVLDDRLYDGLGDGLDDGPGDAPDGGVGPG